MHGLAMVANHSCHEVLRGLRVVDEPSLVQGQFFIVLDRLLNLLRATHVLHEREALQVQHQDLWQQLELHATHGQPVVDLLRSAVGLQRRAHGVDGRCRDVEVQVVEGLQRHTVHLRPLGPHGTLRQAAEGARDRGVLVQAGRAGLDSSSTCPHQGGPRAGGNIIFLPGLACRAFGGVGGDVDLPLRLVVHLAEQPEEKLPGVLLRAEPLPRGHDLLDLVHHEQVEDITM
mmetsp:Transcript_52758/g.171611  ORF Transcript_52758/g.171611 Transcript_52758/m.171611 type:complete len:230 (-) Transcript_52758:703-1392(-)